MKNKDSALLTKSCHKGYDLEPAYKLAREQLIQLDDFERQCDKSGAQYKVIDSQKVIVIKYLNQSYLITLPQIEISLVDSADKVQLKDKLLMLHYLTSAKGSFATDKLVTFRELPAGSDYFRTFSKRVIDPLLAHFGKEPHLLLVAAERLGGYKVDYGDMAVTINAFSRVPITIVLWRGDEEFDPGASILFDSTIADYLSAYDITVLCETITWKLVNYLRET